MINDQLDDETLQLYKNIASNPKVPMTLRVGIAGPRHISAEKLASAASTFSAIFTNIATTLNRYIKSNNIAKELYDFEHQALPVLRITSSLAIGVDRLSMSNDIYKNLQDQACLDYAAVLPFLLEDCEQGFFEETLGKEQNAKDWLELNKLISRLNQQETPRLLELNGDISTPDSQDAAHYRAAKYLVENIDLLLVVTVVDNSPVNNQHKAGTNCTLNLAKQAGHPVIEIAFDENSSAPDIIIHQAKRFGRNENPESYTEYSLERLLSRLVLFGSLFKLPESLPIPNKSEALNSEAKEKLQASILEGLHDHINDSNCLSVINSSKEDVNFDFDYQGPIVSLYSKWDLLKGFKAFEWFKSFLSNRSQIEKIKKEKELIEVTELQEKTKNASPQKAKEAHYWFAYFLRADRLAVRYASIHRSTYLLIYLAAAAALITAAMALTFQHYTTLVFALIILETMILAFIFYLYKGDHHNHAKWLQNRCLAEAIRPNIYFSQFGRCFSFFNIRSSTEFMYRNVMGHNQSGSSWVCIQAELINRHLGFGPCRHSKESVEHNSNFLLSKWISGQINYHLSNTAKMQNIGHWCSLITLGLFTATCIALFTKGGLFVASEFGGINLYEYPSFYWLYKIASLLTAAFPILATSVFAIRHHSEFDISSQRSQTMLAFFYSVLNSVVNKKGIDLDTDLNQLASVSAKEVADWLEIYEVKESEPG